MNDAEVLTFLADRAAKSKYVTSRNTAPVMRFRSTTTRASTGSAPYAFSASRIAQWDVAADPAIVQRAINFMAAAMEKRAS